MGGCGNTFELAASMQEAPNLKPTCKSCKKRKPVHRDYLTENHSVIDTTPKTIGALAERNTQKKSADEIASIKRKNNEYKNKPLEIPLGPGMEQVQRDSQGHIKVSQSQTKVDKRKRKHASK